MTTRTTTLLMSGRAWVADWFRRYDPWTVGALAVVLIIVVGVLRSAPAAAPRTAPAATLAPVLLVVTARPEPTDQSIAVQSAALRLKRAVVAFGEPNGDDIGAIEPGRAYEVLARSGTDWYQLDVERSGIVWVRSRDLDVPDIATPPPPTEAPIVVEQAAPVVVATPAPEPTAAPKPAFRVGGCSIADPGAKCSRTLPRR